MAQHVTTASDFAWSDHALKRARVRLSWTKPPSKPVARTAMVAHTGCAIWVGEDFALFVDAGTVVTVIGRRQAKRGHWKSPSFDPGEEYRRATAPQLEPPMPTVAAVLASMKRRTCTDLACVHGVSTERMAVLLRRLRLDGMATRSNSKRWRATNATRGS